MTEDAFHRFAAEAEAADSTRRLWAAARRWLRTEGVVRLSYHHYPGTAGLAPTDSLSIDGFPEDWAAAYVAENLQRVDPIPRVAMRTFEPFHWEDAAAFADVSSAEMEYLRRLTAAELGDGLAVQVFGPDGRNGYCGLGFGGARRDLAPDRLRLLQAGCQIGHLRYCLIAPLEAPDRSGLTPREREVLHWIVQGKSNSVIADILGCSPHTVDTHARRIFRKLDVGDRISAAVQAVGRGIVTG
ncbi:MAG: LuxR family transcriptional regulator [Pseudomonadota bacterium]